ncbi:hypothetical protein MUA01_00200, partial [Enterobacteriaceae bacterium H18W14]|uniref:hypothetical protein n=1 Tax=Dryocola boscaweniae TaxID=2925397 RepID=UPI0022F01875
LSAHGNSNAAKAAGTGKLLFWCTVTNNANHKKYVLDNKRDEMFAAGVEDVVIGCAKFIIDAKYNIYPSLTVEGGYKLADYTGQHTPLPGRIRRVIKLEPFQG